MDERKYAGPIVNLVKRRHGDVSRWYYFKKHPPAYPTENQTRCYIADVACSAVVVVDWCYSGGGGHEAIIFWSFGRVVLYLAHNVIWMYPVGLAKQYNPMEVYIGKPNSKIFDGRATLHRNNYIFF